MAFHGDLFSFPLPELLQWLHASRKTGTLQLSWEAGERKLFLLSGQLVATASQGLWERIARMLSLSHLSSGEEVLHAFAEMKQTGDAEKPFSQRKLDPGMGRQLARDELFGAIADLTAAQHGHFHWTEDPDRGGDEWVPVQMGVNELLFESLRWVDEQSEVEKALPLDSINVRALRKPSPDLLLLQRVILTLCQDSLNLGRLRLAMGVSRSAATRRVYDLLRLKMVEVDGAAHVELDPVAEMLEKGSLLVRERQFDAAALIFSALLESDPADRRVREFARMVEREHVASLYQDLPPVFIPDLLEDPELLQMLRPEERHVASLVNGSWDVATIVLASQSRELETLKSLAKLSRMGMLRPSPKNEPLIR
jgi:hypothetical protein